MEDSSCDGCATIRSRIRASNAIAASRTFQRPRRSHAHLRFCLFISSTLALLIDTARFKLCACLVSRSRLLLFHQEGGGEKKRFARCWLDFHDGRISSLSKCGKIDLCKNWNSFESEKELRGKKIELVMFQSIGRFYRIFEKSLKKHHP